MGTYKDSGIEWIGEFPEGWGIARMQDVASYKKGPFGSSLTLDMFVEKGESTYKVYEQKNAIQGDSHLGEYYIDEKTYNQLRGFSVQSNDIIVSCAGTIGKCTILPENCEPGIINQALMRVRINKNINIFYYLYLFNIELDYADRKFSNGSAIKNIPPFNVLKKLKLPLPPLQEQAAIADFLDKRNAEFDAITAKITQQIQALKDYRQSLITETVTKGLDKTVSYKDSGIEWIGEIPEEWSVIRLKYITDFKTGGTPSDKEGIDDIGEYPWITTKDMNSYQILNPYLFISREVVNRYNYKLFPSKSILMVCIASIGKISLIETESYSNQQITALINSTCNEKFLLYAIVQQMDKIKLDALSNVIPIINTSYLSNINIAVPPLQEQAAIADYLDDKTTKIDRIIAKKEQQLELIKEHRKSLIYEYVTGKKRVKEYQQDGN